MLTAWCFVGADAWRRDWQYIKPARHVLGAIALYTFWGAALGACAWVVTRLDAWVLTRLTRARVGKRLAVLAATYGVIAGACAISTAFWTFSGEMISKTSIARWGPYAFLLVIGAAAAGASHVLRCVMARVHARRYKLAFGLVLAAFAVSLALIAADLTLYVALYPHLHSLLELCAELLQGAAFTLLLTIAGEKWPAWQAGVRYLATATGVWALAVVVVRPIRTWLDDALRHVWLDEVYAGRVLRRVQTAEAVASNPFHFRGLGMSRLERLRERYDIRDFDLAPEWQEPLSEPRELADRIREIRGERRDFNIVVFYVDTLRRDVAFDPAIMPNVARFAREALRFDTAYATGSDTLRSLPGITSGNYNLRADHANDLLAVARRSELTSVLFIAQSAYEFLAKLRPSFKFEETVRIPDYPPNRTDVWGYGADGPTAGALVDHALSFLNEHKKQRSLLWLFNFDQHNWRELDAKYVDDAAKRYEVAEPGPIPWRYRVVARAVDGEFGRLIDGIEQAGQRERTIVVFLSDHGEALGRDGFWVHSVFLWECLVRVPLLVRIPGIAPQTVDEPVSLADLAPTLTRYMEYEPSMTGFQGEDLLGYLVPDRPKRRLPILMAGASKDQLVRVGMITPDDRYKLVLSLEAALPELYDLDAADPDAATVAEEHPALTTDALKTLLRSPISPRSPADFEPHLP